MEVRDLLHGIFRNFLSPGTAMKFKDSLCLDLLCLELLSIKEAYIGAIHNTLNQKMLQKNQGPHEYG